MQMLTMQQICSSMTHESYPLAISAPAVVVLHFSLSMDLMEAKKKASADPKEDADR